jgi:hypothetical protein
VRIRHRAVICATVGTVSLASGCGPIPSTTQPKSAATETPKTPPAAAPSELSRPKKPSAQGSAGQPEQPKGGYSS